MNEVKKPLVLRAAPAGRSAPPPTSDDIVVSTPRRLRPGSAREAVASTTPVTLAPDDIVRVELDNDPSRPFVFWTRADDLLRDRGRKSLSRGDGSELWEIDTAPRTDAGAIDPAGPEARGAERGLLGLGIKVLDVFGVNLKQKTAALLGKAFEERQLAGATPGRLHRLRYAPEAAAGFLLEALAGGADAAFSVVSAVTAAGAADAHAAAALAAPGASSAADATAAPSPPPALPTDRPLLVFLHGTMSSVGGSFGKLWAAPAPGTGADAAASGAAVREAIAQRYGDQVYAFEHRSLTESPIVNALQLVAQLPTGAELHLVSHSRGGLVGELLCLGERDRGDDPLRPALLQDLFASDRTVAEQLGLGALDGPAAQARDAAYAADREALAQLLLLLDAKQLKVRRFVRVACPARGTTLASGRMDRWLSVLDLLAPGGLFGDVADFLLAVVKERTDPRGLPGVEAMMPGSALTRLLQQPALVTSADLSVISGDLQPEGRWGQLKLLAVDWFYGGEHDLVVNTGSMLGGIRRVQGAARFQRDQGGNVTHFNYFANPRSVRWLVGGLTRGDHEDGGFLPIAEAKQEEPRWRSAVRASRAATTPRPIAVLIPGTMGSALTVKGRAVWLNYWSLLRGGLSDIGIDAVDVQPVELLDQFYGPLLEHLARTHRVEIFAYDWRLSVRDAARGLAAKLEALAADAERSNQPVHLVAHSMGGLVTRAMMADGGAGTQVWRRISGLANSRLLMLGTPNLGSYEAVRWLTGFNPTEAKLTLLDLRHGVNDIIDIVRRFPGLVELLPFDDASPFAKLAVWTQLKRDLDAGWTPVDDATLRGAASTWTLLRGSTSVDATRVLYVAGCQKATVIGHQVVDDDRNDPGGYTPAPRRRRLEFIATREGDGTVAWASGRLPGVALYYAPDTAHDELCAATGDSRIFRGYVELLTAGATDQLKTTPPELARAAVGEAATFVLPALPVVDDIPGEEQLRSLSFSGARPRRRAAGARPITSTIELGIRHGDLAYARHAVLVGHYQGDTIVSAEAELDRRLQHSLTRRRDLGLYPGASGTHAVFGSDRAEAKPGGALVIGLGQVGELTPSRLETGIRDALLEYALQVAHRPAGTLTSGSATRAGAAAVAAADAMASGEHRRVKVSCLLVGTGAGGLQVGDSIDAMVRGALAANHRLEQARLDQRVLIDELEFLELYEDIAITAARELGKVLANNELAPRVTWPSRCIVEGEGRRRRSSFTSDQLWWQRLEITEEDASVLRFVATTDRARAEETLALGQLRLADAFIAQACGSAASNADVAKTLFEMLLPQGLKESSPEQRDIVLLLDSKSARFPWELLENRWSPTGRPPAVASGMVRQLKTSEFRLAPKHALDNGVYVVGNPDLNGWSLFPDLPGARREAEMVRRLFDASSYATLASIDEKSDQILAGLHSRAWRVLHLAGHGEHEYALPVPDGSPPGTVPRRVSGMVIGDNTFLAPGDIEQMRYVPELVFINCCHLGATQNLRTPSFHRLAANLGVEFIRMGVKAVIAAGWAVDDGAAETFAQTFYDGMLGGASFGRAVQAAREATWRSHPGANTWGAYQCYGDQSWHMRRDASATSTRPVVPYVAAAEWLADLGNLAESLRMTSQSTVDDAALAADMRSRLEALQDRVPDASRERWLARADVAAAIGFVYAEAGEYSEAIDWLERSLKSTHNDTPVRAVEQCANLKVRQAVSEWVRAAAAGGATSTGASSALDATREAIVARIEAAIAELSFINDRAPNAERMCLLGSAHKRLACVLTPGEARNVALVQMTEHYAAALRVPDAPRQVNLYAFGNWALARMAVANAHPDNENPEHWRRSLADLCTTCEQQALLDYEERPDFWSGAGIADIHLVQLLAAQDEAQAGVLVDAVLAQYAAVLERGASARERATVREHVDFLIAISHEREAALQDALRRIREAV